MILGKGIITVRDSDAETQELEDDVGKLKDGEYGYLIFDKEQNKALPQLKYLFGIVLKSISNALPEHPTVNALYRYFEEIYAPLHTCNIAGEQFDYFDLKSDPSIEMNEVIEKIIHHAKEEWGINVITKDELKSSEAKAPYTEAYANQWIDYSRKI